MTPQPQNSGRGEARVYSEGWPQDQSVSYCDVCDDPDNLLAVPDEPCGHDDSHRRHGAIQVVPLSDAERLRARVERLEEALEFAKARAALSTPEGGTDS